MRWAKWFPTKQTHNVWQTVKNTRHWKDVVMVQGVAAKLMGADEKERKKLHRQFMSEKLIEAFGYRDIPPKN